MGWKEEEVTGQRVQKCKWWSAKPADKIEQKPTRRRNSRNWKKSRNSQNKQKCTKHFYYRKLSKASFRFCETCLLHIRRSWSQECEVSILGRTLGGTPELRPCLSPAPLISPPLSKAPNPTSPHLLQSQATPTNERLANSRVVAHFPHVLARRVRMLSCDAHRPYLRYHVRYLSRCLCCTLVLLFALSSFKFVSYGPGRSACVSVSVSLCHCVSVSMSLCLFILCLCVSVSLCLCVSVSPCLRVSVSPCLCVSMSLCLCVSVHLRLCASVSLCFFVSVSLCICVYVSICLFTCVSMSLCVSVSLCVYVSACTSVRVSYVRLCVHESVCLRVYASTSLCVCVCLCFSVSACVCVSVCL